ncbi:MAG: DUF1697 domain-containing protein [Fibrobacteria bacterium]
MTINIALLRGINVSGHKPVPMADLKAMFAKLGFKDAKTYIQSGNVVFRNEGKDPGKSAKVIEAGILKTFGYEVPVIVRTADQMAAVVKANPWRKKKLAESERVHISYLDQAPSKEAAAALSLVPGGKDELILAGTEAFILARGGYGNCVFSNSLLEKKLKVRSTTRNLETTMKLLALTEGIGSEGI